MKKLLCFVLTVLIVFSLCSCNFDFSFFEDFTTSEVQNIERYFYNGVEINISDNDVIKYDAEEAETVQNDFNSAYQSLNKQQQRMYRIFLNVSENMPSGLIDFGVSNECSEKDLMIAYQAMLNDNTQIFWMPSTYVYGTNTVKGNNHSVLAFKYSKNGYDLDYTVNKASRDKMRENLEEVVAFVLQHSDGLKSQFEKELFFNDYIRENTTYDLNAQLGNTSYGCLCNGQALCEGYSRAFKLLCNRSDIQCDLVVGTCDNQGHMWNCVNIGGIWSYIDVTWNDIEGERTYAYFNITENQLLKDHTLESVVSDTTDSKTITEHGLNFVKRDCSSNKNNYFIISGYLFDSDFRKIAKDIDRLNESGEKETEYMFISDSEFESFEKDSNAYLQKIQNHLRNTEIESYGIIRDVITIKWK